jgi:hypothetical protein
MGEDVGTDFSVRLSASIELSVRHVPSRPSPRPPRMWPKQLQTAVAVCSKFFPVNFGIAMENHVQ